MAMSRNPMSKKDIESIVYSYFREQFATKDVQWRPPIRGLRIDGGDGGGVSGGSGSGHDDLDGRGGGENTTRLSETEEQSISTFIYVLNKLTGDFRASEGYNQLREKVDTVITNLDSSFDQDRFDESGFVIFSGIAEQLLAEGIKWSHILTLFVFTFELAYEFYQIRNITIVDPFANWLITYVSERLLDWINNHGGWNGLVDYSNQPNSNSNLSDPRFWRTAALVGGALVFITISMQLLH